VSLGTGGRRTVIGVNSVTRVSLFSQMAYNGPLSDSSREALQKLIGDKLTRVCEDEVMAVRTS